MGDARLGELTTEAAVVLALYAVDEHDRESFPFSTILRRASSLAGDDITASEAVRVFEVFGIDYVQTTETDGTVLDPEVSVKLNLALFDRRR